MREIIPGLYTFSNLLAGRDLIGIIPHQIDLFLFNTPVKPFRDGIVRGATDAGKRESRFEILKLVTIHD